MDNKEKELINKLNNNVSKLNKKSNVRKIHINRHTNNIEKDLDCTVTDINNNNQNICDYGLSPFNACNEISSTKQDKDLTQTWENTITNNYENDNFSWSTDRTFPMKLKDNITERIEKENRTILDDFYSLMKRMEEDALKEYPELYTPLGDDNFALREAYLKGLRKGIFGFLKEK